MSKLIKQEDIEEYEAQEERWLNDEGLFDEYWEKYLNDESLFFDWLKDRFERTAAHFCEMTTLPTAFHHKLVDMLNEAAMTGFFFGNLRWTKDINEYLNSALDEPNE